MPLTDQDRDDINEALFAGRKIEAIKIYREATGQGLLEAKEFIDKLADRLREKYPDRMPANSAGCGMAVLMLGAIGGILWRMVS